MKLFLILAALAVTQMANAEDLLEGTSQGFGKTLVICGNNSRNASTQHELHKIANNASDFTNVMRISVRDAKMIISNSQYMTIRCLDQQGAAEAAIFQMGLAQQERDKEVEAAKSAAQRAQSNQPCCRLLSTNLGQLKELVINGQIAATRNGMFQKTIENNDRELRSIAQSRGCGNSLEDAPYNNSTEDYVCHR